MWSRLEKKHVSYCGYLSAKAAARDGHVNILEYLSMHDWWSGDDVPRDLCRIAIIEDERKVLQWLLDHGHNQNKHVARTAAIHGSTEALDILLEYDNPFSPHMNETFVACCVQHRRLDSLQWCYDTLRTEVAGLWSEDNLRKWMLLAGTYDRQGSAEFLLQHGAVWPDIGLKIGTWINVYDDVDSSDTSDYIIKCQWNVPFLKWAIARGCTFGSWTVSTCARLTKETDWSKHSSRPLMRISAFAHANGCPCECPPDAKDF